MKKLFALLIAFLLLSFNIHAQDTFSIVAVDTVTGEIGSAGASCIDETQIAGGAIIISDVLPGRGAIHTQSYWNTVNQQNAHARMVEGMSPQEIIAWLIAHDAQNNPGVRQYGIVDFDSAGHSRSAAFTGANCLNYKNHIVGPNYSIQGNILLGQQILDSIEAGFLNTEGSLAEKLMAALQGAKVPGADTRCTENGTSSLSAFIRIAHPWDVEGSFYCDLNVPSLPEGMEPIDSLQTLFDQWMQVIVGTEAFNPGMAGFEIYPNPARDHINIRFGGKLEGSTVGSWTNCNSYLAVINSLGSEMKRINLPGDNLKAGQLSLDVSRYPAGVYFIIIDSGKNGLVTKKFLKLP